MAMPALKRTPHTTIKQGQEHASHPVIFASEPQNHQQPISNSQTLLPLASELNKAFNQSPCTQTFNQPLGLLLYLLVSTGPAKLEASKSSRKLAPVLMELAFHLRETDVI